MREALPLNVGQSEPAAFVFCAAATPCVRAAELPQPTSSAAAKATTRAF